MEDSALSTLAPPILLSKGHDHALGSWGDHLIGVWDGAITVPSVRTWRKHLQAMAKERPGRAVYVSYERPGFKMPSDAVRDVVIDALRSVDGTLAACAVVLPTSRFTSAAVRALVSGLSLVSRIKTPFQCLATIDDAHAWVVRVAPHVTWPSSAALREAVAILERRVGGDEART